MTPDCDHSPSDTCPFCRQPTPRPADLPRSVRCKVCNGRGLVPDLNFIAIVVGEKKCKTCNGVGSLVAT